MHFAVPNVGTEADQKLVSLLSYGNMERPNSLFVKSTEITILFKTIVIKLCDASKMSLPRKKASTYSWSEMVFLNTIVFFIACMKLYWASEIHKMDLNFILEKTVVWIFCFYGNNFLLFLIHWLLDNLLLVV